MSESASGEATSSSTENGKESSLCDVCGKSYNYATDLTAHLRNHHPDELISCPSCDKGFLSDAGVKQHHARTHGESIAFQTKPCDNCGSEVEVGDYEIDRQDNHFCDKDCFNEYNKNRVTVECDVCGVDFDVIEFRADTASCCSKQCRIEKTRRITGQDRYNYKENNSDNYGEGWYGLRNKIREEYNRICQGCGAHESQQDTKLDVHHVIPRSKFDDLNEANKRENLVPLCKSCHKTWEGIHLKPQLVD